MSIDMMAKNKSDTSSVSGRLMCTAYDLLFLCSFDVLIKIKKYLSMVRDIVLSYETTNQILYS